MINNLNLSVKLTPVHKLSLKIKLTVILVFLSFLDTGAATSIYSQNTKFTLDLKNVTVEEVFNQIKNNSDLKILHATDEIDLQRLVSISVKQQRVEVILKQLFSTRSIIYRIVDKQIVLSLQKKSPASTGSKKVDHIIAVQNTVTGTVSDANGPLLGATVLVKGMSNGTNTDFYGKYTIEEVGENAILVISFVGYVTQEVVVGDSKIVNVVLIEQSTDLDEIVVVGYSTVKKKLSVGANLNMKGGEIEKLTPNSAIEALQGISPGVIITQKNGQPGAGTKVYVRGVGTIGNAKPLYIVDGVYVGNIDYLNPADIASIDVLKDAASAAIYGSSAANGVILVTTKKGKKGKPVISFDSYFGLQNVYKKPDLLNAQEYAFIMNEAQRNDGKALFDYTSLVPSWKKIEEGWKGTDWFDEITTKNAPVYNTSLSVLGGSDTSKYSLGVSQYKQVGIIGGDLINSGYERLTLRMNTEFVLAEKDDHDLIIVGENLTYTNINSKRVADGNIYWNDLHRALVTNPFMPVRTDGQYTKDFEDWDDGSQPNPLGILEYERNRNWGKSNSIVGNFYVKIQPIKDLELKSTFGISAGFGHSRSLIPPHDLGSKNKRISDKATQSMWQYANWTWTNTVNYKRIFNDNHTLSVLVGNEVQKPKLSLNLKGEAEDSKFFDPSNEKIYLNNFNFSGASKLLTLEGIDWAAQGGGKLSYFSRLSYDYKEKYLLTMVLRADASANFAKGKRWGAFPSVAAGWIVTSEDFFKETSLIDYIDYLKFRASWGQNGNDNIENFLYASSLATGGLYFFGDKEVSSPIAYPSNLPNPDISWETSEQINFGFDAYLFSSKLNLIFDWYKKTTKDWLVKAPVIATSGFEKRTINGGEIMNQGIELALSWKEKEQEFKWGISASIAFNKNEVTKINNTEKVIHGSKDVISQGTSELFRAKVGHPIGYFWGYKTAGILQNKAEVDAYVVPKNKTTEDNGTAGKPYFNDSRSGDVRFVDQNADGKIDDKDKVELGDPNPKWIYGLQLNAEYKGVYLNATLTGQAGMQIMKSYRSFADSPKQNYTSEIFNRWHGEGTSNRIPRLSSSTNRNTNYVSDIYLHDADFLRVSNITVGYNLKNEIKNIKFISTLKVYGTIKNLYTFTKYNGLDPEVGYGPVPWSSGIDLGLYPQARTVLMGLNVSF